MKRFRKLLVGLDLTADGDRITTGSRKAAVQAQWLAAKTGAELTFLHSTYHDRFEDHQIVRLGPSEDGALELESLVREYSDAGVPTELVYSEERPWLAMIRRVLAGKNDLVVVAKRNESADDQRPIGSLSLKLLRKCPSPVWVVKPDHDLVHRLVIAATDLTEVGDLATEFGAYVAAAHDCDLQVLHAWQISFELQMEAAQLSDEELTARKKEIEEQAVGHIRGVLQPLGMTRNVGLHVLNDAPSRAILREVEESDPDVLVMGTLSRGGIAGFLVGNTAEKLLERVDCSLLTIKPDDFVSPVLPD